MNFTYNFNNAASSMAWNFYVFLLLKLRLASSCRRCLKMLSLFRVILSLLQDVIGGCWRLYQVEDAGLSCFRRSSSGFCQWFKFVGWCWRLYQVEDYSCFRRSSSGFCNWFKFLLLESDAGKQVLDAAYRCCRPLSCFCRIFKLNLPEACIKL
jgi:hypothetical protein